MRGISLMAGALGSLLAFDGAPLSAFSFPAPAPKPRRTTWHQQHGKREKSRRQRQIAAGSLRVENGLVA